MAATAPAAAPGLFAARPRIDIGGSQSEALSDALQALFVEETTDGLARCEATFANWGPRNGGVGFIFLDRSVVDFGKALKIEMGAGQAAGVVFDGRVMALEGHYLRDRAPEMVVLAEDRLQDLRMTRRTRTFENLSDSEVVRQIAGAHGLQVTVDLSGPTHKVVAQVNQSDLAFLRDRARAADAEVWLDGTSLYVKPRPQRGGTAITLAYGATLFEFSVTADLSGQVSGFTVAGWDVSGKQAASSRAAESAISGELNGTDSGSSILGSAIGTRDQQVVHELPADTNAARALAESYYRRTARRFVRGSGIAEGNAKIRVGANVTLSGLGGMFDGKYYVARARHLFDPRQGYRTMFDVERPGIGR
jgi:hypothetical protein